MSAPREHTHRGVTIEPMNRAGWYVAFYLKADTVAGMRQLISATLNGETGR